MTHDNHWIEIPGSIFQQDGVVRLLVSADTDQMEVMHALLEGVYDKPFVMDDGVVRSLHFDFDAPQSEMLIDDPNALTFAYTRKMMGFLLFQPKPQHVVIVGLGGGSLSKFCYQQLPSSRLTTLEICEHVIGLSEIFEMPPVDDYRKVVHADADEYFSTTEERMDVVLVDGCDDRGTSAVLCEPNFLHELKKRLYADGVLVMNLTGLGEQLSTVVDSVEACFGNRPLLIDASESHNKILFAFNAPNKVHNWAALRQQAMALAELHGLDFPALVDLLEREDV